MAIIVGRRRRRRTTTLGERTRTMMTGLIQLGLATTILAVGSAVSQALRGYVIFTIAGVDVDLGIIVSAVLVFGGLLLFLSGFRKIAWIRI